MQSNATDWLSPDRTQEGSPNLRIEKTRRTERVCLTRKFSDLSDHR
jgi:hypothetical protein